MEELDMDTLQSIIVTVLPPNSQSYADVITLERQIDTDVGIQIEDEFAEHCTLMLPSGDSYLRRSEWDSDHSNTLNKKEVFSRSEEVGSIWIVKGDHTQSPNDERSSNILLRMEPEPDQSTTGSTDTTKYHCDLRMTFDPILASCVLSEVKRSMPYRELFVKKLCQRCSAVQSGRRLKMGLTDIHLVLELGATGLFQMEPDIQWSKKMLPELLMRLSIEDAFSWLSTLGGAYSALGDDFQQFAEKAGRVSLRQMKLACRIGDPILKARCRVYMAQSLLQQGHMHAAKHIIRTQYNFALSLGDATDQRLINMCKGVWSILQYFHRRKREQRRQNGATSLSIQAHSSQAYPS